MLLEKVLKCKMYVMTPHAIATAESQTWPWAVRQVHGRMETRQLRSVQGE